MDKPPLIRRVVIHNYKSIEKCDVTLGRFNVFVGRNGSGKSNFLDALQFVADALRTGSVSNALESRGGMQHVVRQSMNAPRSFRVELHIQHSATQRAEYYIEIAERPNGGFAVEQEELFVSRYNDDARVLSVFRCNGGSLLHANVLRTATGDISDDHIRKVSTEVLYLPMVSLLPEYESAYKALCNLTVYNPIPDPMRPPHLVEEAPLKANGSNLTSAVSRLSRERPETLARIVEYLAAIVPGLSKVSPLAIGSSYEILEFQQQIAGESASRMFESQNMSDGTLRSLAVLVAALQFYQPSDPSHVIGIEEPESAIHPAAMAVLLDALRESSVNNQVLITTHSPDLLDRVDIDTDSLFAVSDSTGSTVIEPIDNASAMAIRKQLYTAGDLLRMDQLEPRSVHTLPETVPE